MKDEGMTIGAVIQKLRDELIPSNGAQVVKVGTAYLNVPVVEKAIDQLEQGLLIFASTGMDTGPSPLETVGAAMLLAEIGYTA